MLIHGPQQFTVAPGYSLDDAGLREEPSLLSGLARSADSWEPSFVSGELLVGQASLSGDWPGRAEVVLNPFPLGGCDRCDLRRYGWDGQRWRENAKSSAPARPPRPVERRW